MTPPLSLSPSPVSNNKCPDQNTSSHPLSTVVPQHVKSSVVLFVGQVHCFRKNHEFNSNMSHPIRTNLGLY